MDGVNFLGTIEVIRKMYDTKISQNFETQNWKNFWKL